jgi:hypothetical protein
MPSAGDGFGFVARLLVFAGVAVFLGVRLALGRGC